LRKRWEQERDEASPGRPSPDSSAPGTVTTSGLKGTLLPARNFFASAVGTFFRSSGLFLSLSSFYISLPAHCKLLHLTVAVAVVPY